MLRSTFARLLRRPPSLGARSFVARLHSTPPRHALPGFVPLLLSIFKVTASSQSHTTTLTSPSRARPHSRSPAPLAESHSPLSLFSFSRTTSPVNSSVMQRNTPTILNGRPTKPQSRKGSRNGGYQPTSSYPFQFSSSPPPSSPPSNALP